MKDLNGITRGKFDDRGRADFRPLRPSLVTSNGGPVTPDEEERKFVPKRALSCHGEPNQRLGFRRRDGIEVSLEKTCPRCRAEVARASEVFAYKSKSGDLERLATFYLKKSGVRVSRRGEVQSKREPQEPWEKEVGDFPRPQGFKGYKR